MPSEKPRGVITLKHSHSEVILGHQAKTNTTDEQLHSLHWRLRKHLRSLLTESNHVRAGATHTYERRYACARACVTTTLATEFGCCCVFRAKTNERAFFGAF